MARGCGATIEPQSKNLSNRFRNDITFRHTGTKEISYEYNKTTQQDGTSTAFHLWLLSMEQRYLRWLGPEED